MLLSGVMTVSGCVLEDSWTFDFLNEDGELNRCENVAEIYYPKATNREGSCLKKDCVSEDDCCDLPPDLSSLFYRSFTEHLCSSSMSCLKSTKKEFYYCEEAVSCGQYSCIAYEGWQDGTCEDMKCRASSCFHGYHIYNDYKNGRWLPCQKDTAISCGSSGVGCSEYFESLGEKEKYEGVAQYNCLDGTCAVSKCDEHYHWNRTADGCEADSPEACGSFNSSCFNMEGWIEEEGNICTDTFDCYAVECAEHYHPYNVANERGVMIPCEPSDVENCSAHGDVCNADTVPNANAFDCVANRCVATQCEAGYHLYEGRCEIDSIADCGEHGVECNELTVPNGTEFDCLDAQCVATRCDETSHLYNGICEIDSVSQCDGHHVSCNNTTVPHGTSFNCVDKKCIAQACEPNFHIYGGACEADDVNNCGVHGTVCAIPNGTPDCSTGTCKPKACNAGYHVYGTTCEANDVNNCGTHGAVCAIPAGTPDCSTGTCKPKACNAGYHVYGTTCEANSISNCGAHGAVCSFPYAYPVCTAAGGCSFGGCEPEHLNCDGNVTNGCEVDLYRYGLSGCGRCEHNYTQFGMYSTNIPYCVRVEIRLMGGSGNIRDKRDYDRCRECEPGETCRVDVYGNYGGDYEVMCMR